VTQISKTLLLAVRN